MYQVLIAFVTGLTAGGLSCLAVQGGLLASSIAHQVEQDVDRQGDELHRQSKKRVAQPILLFLIAKLVAYTLLGLLLGLIGSVLQLTPLTRAILQFAIGVFMIGNALRMFNVHPIFRYFSFEPPSFLTRYIRKRAKTSAGLVTPLFLGALTVLIPCGVTQAMMALAAGTGSPLMGAALMASFILGTSPVFFALAYFATRLGARAVNSIAWEKRFMQVTAVVVLVLGLISIESGLNLAGSPVSFANLTRSLGSAAAQTLTITPVPTLTAGSSRPVAPGPNVADTTGDDVLTINVVNNGYKPSVLHASADKPLKLSLVTDNTRGCSRAFTIPALGIEEVLPATGTVTIDLPAQKAGTVLRFSCSMGMYTGQIQFDAS